ncbi:LysR family transcriptional regulator [Methyloterricola oryzae]|uniref:LysR family transcriptional regulator n=1 Tax=Methyloterricola oryzae TaxID=1495050 RepID=UPI0005EAF765|nr:LysR family transcriptional regulator [Methyloterricola oryzae]
MNVSLRQLKLFESVARNLSFTRAAEEMHLTQPAVSIQVKQLEDSVGLPLFEQIGKKIYLTETGQSLKSLCDTILGELARFEMEVADRKGLKQGQLRLGVTTTAKYFVPGVLGPFCDLYPGIEVSLKVSNQQALLERLARNEDDLYILGRPPKQMAVTALPFMANPLVMLAHPEHPLAGVKNIPPQRFAEEWFLMREPGSGTRTATERFFAERGISLRERLTLGSNEAIKQAVMAKLGVAVLSRSTIALESEVGRMVILDVEGFPIRRHWHIVYPADKRLSVVAQTFCDYLGSHTQAAGEPSAPDSEE